MIADIITNGLNSAALIIIKSSLFTILVLIYFMSDKLMILLYSLSRSSLGHTKKVIESDEHRENLADKTSWWL